MSLSDEQVAEAVLAFVGATTYAERKQIVAAYHDVLLDPLAGAYLTGLLTDYKDDEAATRRVREDLELLARCEQEGIDAAFADRLPSSMLRDSEVDALMGEFDALRGEVDALVEKQDNATEDDSEVDALTGELNASVEKLGKLTALVEEYREAVDEFNALMEELSRLTAPRDMPRAVLLCRAALTLVSRDEKPDLWASLQARLGECLEKNPAGQRAENVELAIHHNLQALKVLAREDAPEQWAQAHSNLAMVYAERVRGEQAENVERAIHHYRQALEVRTRQDYPHEWAATQLHLANAYLDRVEEERAENIEDVIHHYQQALEIFTRQDFPNERATIQLTLGSVYMVRIEGEQAENVERAIHHYRQALEVRTRQDYPHEWADVQDSLGSAYSRRVKGDRAENVERAIHHYREALEIFTRQAYPFEWATTQGNLGIIYAMRVRGERAENLEGAIRRLELALEVLTREDSPHEWATAQSDLASAYRSRVRGDRAENLEGAIRHNLRALEVRTREDYPFEWAATQGNLAAAYADRVRGERAENLEEAIRHNLRALEVRTREDFPDDWAMTQSTLGKVFLDRVEGERAENIEDAIGHFRRALEILTRQDRPGQWAAAQSNLGLAYATRVRGSRTENLEEAIRRRGLALEVITREDFPERWAVIQNELARVYGDRDSGDKAENLEEAIRRRGLALEVLTRRDYPFEWATTQDNLGIIYAMRVRGERAENLEEAIRRLELALEVLTREDSPHEWATAQSDLASAYRSRVRGDRAENLEEAIRHNLRALEVLTREDSPYRWGLAQSSLAAAYADRVRGDRAENLEEAIRHNLRALEVSRRDYPFEWAATQDNLGAFYAIRVRGSRAENLEEAIRHLELALEVLTRQDLPLLWAVTQGNLAVAYADRVRGDRAENLEEAIRHNLRALEVLTRQNFPQAWVRTQANLGYDYGERARGDRAENLEEAIRHYRQALGVTRRDSPHQWAATQHGLGLVYADRVRGERAENLEEAIRRLELALEVRTAKALPMDCLMTAYSLGNLLYDERRFSEARAALATAHEAVEALRGEVQREGAKRDLAEQNADLYARLVHCCLIEGDEEAAFRYATAGKGRALVDMLATARFDLSAAGADDPELAEDLRQARELRQQIDNLLARLSGEGGASFSPGGNERRSPVDVRSDLRALQERDAALWEDMAYKYPALTATQRAPSFAADEARKLSEDLGATLVECYQHAGGWCAFVLTPNEMRCVPLPGIDEDLLDRMLKWLVRIESPTGRGRLSYGPLCRLHEALVAPLRGYLPPGERVVLAPFAHLHLLPLSAALDPESGRYASEDYELAFAPSLAALRTSLGQEAKRAQQTPGTSSDTSGWLGKLRGAFGRERARAGSKAAGQRLLSVAYPGAPESGLYLPNVLPEAEAAGRHFAQVTPLQGEAATPDAVLSHARGQDVVHLGCHGWFDPEAPEQSGLMLSGGWLTVQRIVTELRLDRAKLATMSACLSGRVEVRRGEEHVGLLQGVMSAGARAVVASLWPVNDASTRALFEAFYAGVEAGSSPASALADAARLVQGRPGWEHPYYWGAFQVSGLAHAGTGGPGLEQWSGEVMRRIAETHHESVESIRGGSLMDVEETVRDSQVLLEQMTEEPEAVLEALQPAERTEVVTELRALSGRAAEVQTEAELVEVADAVHRLVEETPALAALLLPKEMDVTRARKRRKTRKITVDQHEAAYSKDLHAQEHAARIRNRVVECRGQLEQALQSFAEAKSEGDR